MKRVDEWGVFRRGDEVTLDGGNRHFTFLGAELADGGGGLRHLLVQDPRNGSTRPVRAERVAKVIGALVAGMAVDLKRMSEKGTPGVYRTVNPYRGEPVVIVCRPDEPPDRRWQLTMKDHPVTHHRTKKACVDEVRARLDKETQAA